MNRGSDDMNQSGTSPRASNGSNMTHREHIEACTNLAANASSSGSRVGGGTAPLFMLASAAESRKPQTSHDAPVWRIAAGNLAAGAAAGCSVEAALYPIDTIKTRLQAMIGGGGIRALIQSGGGKGLYAGVMVRAAVLISFSSKLSMSADVGGTGCALLGLGDEVGIGVWGNLAGVAPASAVFISIYEPVKQAVENSVRPDQQFLGSICAGMTAGTAASLIRVPTEVIKQRLQTKEFSGASSAVRHVLAKEGVRGLYAGYGAFMMRDLPFDAIEFFVYEQLKRGWTAYNKRELYPQETSLIGAFAGGFTGLVTTPLDVLKTRLMVQGQTGRYTSVFHAMSRIAREEGLGAFMKGWQPRLIWISLGGFVYFPVLEGSKKLFAPAPASTASGHK